jgi:amino acid adenylation domain-containing protein
LPDLIVQYYDYANWQRSWLQGDVLEKQLGYWKNQLSGQPKLLNFPSDRPRPAIQTSTGGVESFNLTHELTQGIKTLSKKENVTLFMFLLAAFQVLLSRYSGQDDISVGTAIANRNLVDTERLIGFFVNTLVMRTDLAGNPTFREVLERVRDITLGAYAHQDLPFELLVEELKPERDLSHTPLFQVAFALQNAPTTDRSRVDPSTNLLPGSTSNQESQKIVLPDLEIEQINVSSGTSKFDLTLSMAEVDGTLNGSIEYNLDLFDIDTIMQLIGNFRTLIEGILSDPNLSIEKYTILTDEEMDQQLVTWNNTEIVTPVDQCAHQRFESRVAEFPDNIAVTYRDKTLSYSDLDRMANRLANYLSSIGVGPEVIVGISTQRSIEMVLGILGVMKAGGAYLPIDPSYPVDRVVFMMEDSEISVLLTQAEILAALPLDRLEKKPFTICLDSDWERKISSFSDQPVISSVGPENLAYIIYTSGSTGLPKGTMLRHNGLSNLAEVQRVNFEITKESIVLQFSPLSFDASVWETFMALANGATLCLADQEVLASGIELVRLLKEQEITNVTLPPSVLRVLPDSDLSNLNTVIAAGEACTPDLVDRWAPDRNFFNAYGPTETTVCASMHLCDATDKLPPPIGKPIWNTKVYILDENLFPVPVGVPGELHVNGISTARGYLRRPEMTAQKFIPDPFGSRPGDRLYKTGDLVRYRKDGSIEFLGRIDQQVKVRGFRIELGEVESILNQSSLVSDGTVVAHEDMTGDTRLIAYYVPQDQIQDDEKKRKSASEIRGFMRQSLPEYMIPSLFIVIDNIPVSPSGKVDKSALPVPEVERSALESVYIEPSTKVEKELANICEELLGLERVGVHDNFFELGGHSLLATQFISRVRESLGVELPLRTVFENPTVAEISKSVEVEIATQSDREKISELLQRINELSEEEALELLELKQKKS